MKFYNSLFLCITLFLSQIFSSLALPIEKDHANALAKRKIHPLPYLNTFIYFKKPDHWKDDVKAYIYEEGKEDLMYWPGISMKYNQKDRFYTFSLEYYHFIHHENLRVVFNDDKKKHQAPASLKEGFKVIMDGVYDETGIIGITNAKPKPVNYNGVEHLFYSTGLVRILYRPKEYFFGDNDIYAHYKIGHGEWNNIPGDKLTGYWGGFYYINIDIHDAQDVTIAFTDGKTWDNNNGKNYYFKKFDDTLIDNNDGNDYTFY